MVFMFRVEASASRVYQACGLYRFGLAGGWGVSIGSGSGFCFMDVRCINFGS